MAKLKKEHFIRNAPIGIEESERERLPIAVIIGVAIRRTIENACPRPLITVYRTDGPCSADREDPAFSPRETVSISTVCRSISPRSVSIAVTAIGPATVVAAGILRLILNVPNRIRTIAVMAAIPLCADFHDRKAKHKNEPYPRKGQLFERTHNLLQLQFL